MGPDGVRVIDFGIARSSDTAATLTSQVFGTPGYMTSEVVRGQPAGPPPTCSPGQMPPAGPGSAPPRRAPGRQTGCGLRWAGGANRSMWSACASVDRWAVTRREARSAGVEPWLARGPEASPGPGNAARLRAGPANAIPAGFAGTWSGKADQMDGLVTRWAATLVLPEGATSGTFTIPAIPCYATVRVTEVTRARIVLSETVDSNPTGRCAASGIISLRRACTLPARMFWQDAGDRANVAAGILTRS